jgi:protein TonB
MSAAGHIVIFTLLGLVPPPSEVLAMQDIEIEVVEPKVKVEPPKPPEPEKEPPPPKSAPRQPAPAAPPPEQPAAPPPPEVADFTGVTLTADGDGASWSTAVGSGAPLKGPVGKIGSPAPQQAAKIAPVGPRFVPAQSLARKPQPPSGLNALLEDNYPRRARMQGVEGKVLVTLRILPSGRVGDMKVVDESPDGFGFALACTDTLRKAPPFLPPLDRSGAAVASEIKFTCTFEVEY